MRPTGRILAEIAGTVLVAAVLVAAGFQAGQDVGRINALRAEASAPVVTIGKRAAAARIDPICRQRVQGSRFTVQGSTRNRGTVNRER